MKSHKENKSEADWIMDSADPVNHLMNDLMDIGLELDNNIATASFLGCVARRFGEGLWILLTGESGCGKTYLRSVMRDCVPEEERLSFEYSSEKALIYRAEKDGEKLDLSQCVLIGDEREIGKDDPRYLRTLYSEKCLEYSVAQAGGTATYKLMGRPSLFETTTDSGINIEDQNRRLILAVDESKEKKQQIVEYANKVAANTSDVDPQQITGIYQELQRMLPRPERVVIPFAEWIVPAVESVGAISRAHGQLLTITKAVALMRYRNRYCDSKQLICELEDYDLAHYLLSPLHNSLVSGVENQERDLIACVLKAVDTMAMSNPKRNRFSTNDIGIWSGLGRGTRERRIKKAVESGLLVQVSGKGRGVLKEYELGDVQGILTRTQLFPTSQEIRSNGYYGT